MQQVYSSYAQYRQQKNQVIESADRVTLIAMLLEGAISYNKKAVLSLEQGDDRAVLEYVNYAIKIILHLYSCLNFDEGGEIAERLGKIYNYVCDQYLVYQKNIKDTTPIDTINTVLGTILEGWKKLPKDSSV